MSLRDFQTMVVVVIAIGILVVAAVLTIIVIFIIDGMFLIPSLSSYALIQCRD
jgi:hypothetical protein